jgi:hypothetical protein
MVRGSNSGASKVFRSGPETHLTFRTMGAECLSPGVALSTQSLLAPNLKKKSTSVLSATLCAFTACYRVKFAVTRQLPFFIFQQLRYV